MRSNASNTIFDSCTASQILESCFGGVEQIGTADSRDSDGSATITMTQEGSLSSIICCLFTISALFPSLAIRLDQGIKCNTQCQLCPLVSLCFQRSSLSYMYVAILFCHLTVMRSCQVSEVILSGRVSRGTTSMWEGCCHNTIDQSLACFNFFQKRKCHKICHSSRIIPVASLAPS